MLAPSDLSFSVESGDVLTGNFTFEPVDAEPDQFGSRTTTDSVQHFEFSLLLDSSTLTTSSYALQATDNQTATDSSIVNDMISLGCTSVGMGACKPGSLDGAQDIIWYFSMPLLADEIPLNGPDISSDPNVWNQFTGHISVTFQNKGIADVLRINAAIVNFSAIPEPSSACLIMPAILVSIGARRPSRIL